ncbi:MAG TPA: hypothetical protein VE075_02080 [Thermoanaerobaculia bacterium]|nr:hypothetical protein [Thermoanaerobaculia bacterium]
MKKTPVPPSIRKLGLSRETLRRLDEADLDQAAGGATLPHTYKTCGTMLCTSNTC